MVDYIKVEFEFLNDEEKDILIALLTEMNYEGFEQEGDLLKAYISLDNFDESELKKIAASYNSSFSITKLENENWNSVWESNFQPVIINHSIYNTPWVAIRANFHKPINEVQHEIIIDPKMSFGTGHHPTTAMMIKMMSELYFTNKAVLDFGTGSGILAIISEKLGASKIVAIDSDDQSISNATENFESNNCKNIQLIKSSTAMGNHKFDIILANILKSVIVDNLSMFCKQLNPNGVVLLSGLLREDEGEILRSAEKNGLILTKKIEMERWICLQMTQ